MIAVAIGLVVGLLTGGRLRHLARHRFRWWLLLPAGIALQALGTRLDLAIGFELVVASYACLALFGLRNLHMAGMVIVVLGLVMNLVPIVANGGMPVRPSAVVAAGVATWDEVHQLELGGKHHLERPTDEWMILADIIPVPPLREVLSFGDLVLSAGIANVLVGLMRPPPGYRRRRDAGVTDEWDDEVIDLTEPLRERAERDEIAERLRSL